MTPIRKILRSYRGSLLFLIAPSILLFVTVKEVRAHTLSVVTQPSLAASDAPTDTNDPNDADDADDSEARPPLERRVALSGPLP